MKWNVIVDREKARVYDCSSKQLTLIKELFNPLGRLKNKDMRHDKPGNSFAKFGKAPPHNLSSRKSQSDVATSEFARVVSDYLVKNIKSVKDIKVQVVAESKLLGKIKKNVGRKVHPDTLEWVSKDLANIPETKWVDLLNLEKRQRPADISSRFNI